MRSLKMCVAHAVSILVHRRAVLPTVSLQAGAAEVACVDVNYGQLAWKLREDERVCVFERTNIKTAVPAELGAPFDIVVADLSFIGLAGLADVFAALCAPGTVCLLLVKPQFESAHDETDRGIVRDESVRLRVVKEVRCFRCGRLLD